MIALELGVPDRNWLLYGAFVSADGKLDPWYFPVALLAVGRAYDGIAPVDTGTFARCASEDAVGAIKRPVLCKTYDSLPTVNSSYFSLNALVVIDR